MKDRLRHMYESLSAQFGRVAGKLSRTKPAFTPEKYNYLQSGDPQIHAAHGLSLMFRPYNENPIFNTEVHRRTAEILHKTGCEPSIVAAMLLQDVIHKPVANRRKTITPDTATMSLFYPDVRNWLNEYKRLNEALLRNENGRTTLIGARLMRVAANIESIDRYTDRTKLFIEHTNRNIKAIEEIAPSTIKDHMIFEERLKSYKELGAVKEQLMLMQEEFEDIKGYNIDLNVAFKGSVRCLNTLIFDWMVENGLETRPKPQRSFLDKRPRGALE